MEISDLLLLVGIIWLFVTSLFVVSIIIKRNDIADIAWGTGILLVAGTSYLLTSDPSLIQDILLLLIALWGLRLTIRIFLRNIKKSEDPRYQNWRLKWGRFFYLRSYLQVYLLQGTLMILVGYTAIHASLFNNEVNLNLLTYVGIAIWCLGYFFEVIGDLQLDRFLNQEENRGKIMQTGLWRYTRHPNYFGEVTMWWGLWLMVATLPYSFIALLSPITITILILKISGIPMLEKMFANNPEFADYKKRTSVFFPLPPKKP